MHSPTSPPLQTRFGLFRLVCFLTALRLLSFFPVLVEKGRGLPFVLEGVGHPSPEGPPHMFWVICLSVCVPFLPAGSPTVSGA